MSALLDSTVVKANKAPFFGYSTGFILNAMEREKKKRKIIYKKIIIITFFNKTEKRFIIAILTMKEKINIFSLDIKMFTLAASFSCGSSP